MLEKQIGHSVHFHAFVIVMRSCIGILYGITRSPTFGKILVFVECAIAYACFEPTNWELDMLYFVRAILWLFQRLLCMSYLVDWTVILSWRCRACAVDFVCLYFYIQWILYYLPVVWIACIVLCLYVLLWIFLLSMTYQKSVESDDYINFIWIEGL